MNKSKSVENTVITMEEDKLNKNKAGPLLLMSVNGEVEKKEKVKQIKMMNSNISEDVEITIG